MTDLKHGLRHQTELLEVDQAEVIDRLVKAIRAILHLYEHPWHSNVDIFNVALDNLREALALAEGNKENPK